jgi:DNA modification methylase
LAVERLMGGEKADMVFTDPPYGIDEQTDRAYAAPSRIAKGNTFRKISGDQNKTCARDACNLILSLDVPICIIWGANHFAHALPESAAWIVWDKRVEDKQRDFNSDCELAWVKHKTKSVRCFRHLWKGLIKASEHGEARVHPTQKPVALGEWAFSEYGKSSDRVLDLFLGSGSTLIACEKTGRKCYGMEIDPHYCDVVIKRWEDFTGEKAELLDGPTEAKQKKPSQPKTGKKGGSKKPSRRRRP